MEKIQTKAILKVIWEQLRKYKRSFLLTMFCVMIASSVDIFLPMLYKRFFDLIAGGVPLSGNLSPFIQALLAILTIHIVGLCTWRASGFLAAWRIPYVMADLARKSHASIHAHSYQFFMDHFAGSLVRKVGRLERAFDTLSEQILWKFLPLTIVLTGYL